jgi:GNAT superfamily N-acetyltransferase
MTIMVSRTTADDWAALKAIRLESLVDTPEAYGSTYTASVKFPDRQWRTMADTRACYLASLDGAVIGMASGGLNDAYPDTRWLFSMYVTSTQRGSAAAASLVDAVAAWAKGEGADELYLHVSKPLVRARAFYAKMGFVETGERFAMDRNPAIELITMTKSLADA